MKIIVEKKTGEWVEKKDFWVYNKYKTTMDDIKAIYIKMWEGVIEMAVVSMEIPDEMLEFAMPSNKDDQLRINAMILYPYIQQGIISHGRAAEILGIFKMDLITLYGKMGLSYIEMSEDEIEEELATVNYLKEVMP